MKSKHRGLINDRFVITPLNQNFQKFGGQEFDSWMLRAEFFFEVDSTPKDSWVKTATLHLEREAIQWHQGLMRARGDQKIQWEEFVQLLNSGRYVPGKSTWILLTNSTLEMESMRIKLSGSSSQA